MKTVLYLGIVLFASGWLHRWETIARLDERLFLAIHRGLAKLTPIFQILWPFGTLFGAIAAAALIGVLGGIKYGAYSLLAYLAALTVEQAIKRTLQRPRPYLALPNVEMRQPRAPKDTSFPSGDALRAWLFAIALAAFLPPWANWVVFSLAALVSVGRIVLGVHHPSDVLTGSGLGIIAGALLRMLW